MSIICEFSTTEPIMGEMWKFWKKNYNRKNFNRKNWEKTCGFKKNKLQPHPQKCRELEKKKDARNKSEYK